MSIAPLDRRSLLRSGAFAAGAFAIAGFGPTGAQAAPFPAREPAPGPLEGAVVAWLVIDPDRGGTVRLVRLDGASRPVREIASTTLPWMAVASAVKRAHAFALDAVAKSWGVDPGSCSIEPQRIVEHAAGRSIGYTLWTDFA